MRRKKEEGSWLEGLARESRTKEVDPWLHSRLFARTVNQGVLFTCTVCMYGHTYSKNMDQPGKVANPARGQLDREKRIFPCPRSRLGIWSRETGSAVPSRVSLLISILRLNLVLTYGIPPEFRGGVHYIFKPPHAIGSVPNSSGHAIA